MSRAQWLALGPAMALASAACTAGSLLVNPVDAGADSAQGVGGVCPTLTGTFPCPGVGGASVECNRASEFCLVFATAQCIPYDAGADVFYIPSCLELQRRDAAGCSCPDCEPLAIPSSLPPYCGYACQEDYAGGMTITGQGCSCYGAPPARVPLAPAFERAFARRKALVS
jgi:hypothetical protein